MKFLLLLVLAALLFSGCSGTAQSIKNIPLLNSYSKGDASRPDPSSAGEPTLPKAPHISPSKAALMETAQLDRF